MTMLGVLKRWGRRIESATESEAVRFVCNVCGADNVLPAERISREDGPCQRCRCYGRLRSVVWALTTRLFGPDVILAELPARKDVRGLGCSDWGYVPFLEEKFDYVNTFYDREPRLDLTQPGRSAFAPASFDFITCTDVLEHVPPPVNRGFETLFRLLRPGGVLVMTVPTLLQSQIVEHFPYLHDWRLAEEGGRRVLINRRSDGTTERFTDLCFHGGEGLTLEFRIFSRPGLVRELRTAGFRIAAVHDRPTLAYGVPLSDHNVVVVAERPR